MRARTTALGLATTLTTVLVTTLTALPAAGAATSFTATTSTSSGVSPVTAIDPARDRPWPFGHSPRGAFLLGRSGEHLVSPSGVTTHRRSGDSAADGMWRLCGDTLVTSSHPVDYADRVSWRDLATGRTGTTTTDRVTNYLGPAPGGILFAQQTPSAATTHSDIVLRTYDGTRRRLATVAGFVGGGAALCDTAGIALLMHVDATTTAPAKDVLSFVRFSGGVVTLDSRTASETSPVTIVEVNGTSVLWSVGTPTGTPTTLYRSDVGGARTTVVTVPSTQYLVGAGASATETLYSVREPGGTVTRSLRSDGTRVVIPGGPQEYTSWWPVGSSWRAAGQDGLWSLTGTTATQLWQPPHVIADLGRQEGTDRYSTATGIQPAGVRPDVVYVASGTSSADALSGTPAAAAAEGALVLTAPTSLPATVRTYLAEHDPAEVVVLGGIGSVSAGVEQALRSYAPTVRRVAGPDRYATAAAVSRDRFPAVLGGTVVVASGASWADALAAGPAAAHWGGPLLLTATDRLPSTTAAELERLQPERIVLVGGTGVASTAVEAALRAHASVVQRVAGANRYATAAAVSAAAFPGGAPTAYVVTGENFPDGLAAGTVAARRGGVILPTARTALPAVVAQELTRLRPDQSVVVGGAGVVSWAAYEDVSQVWWP